MFTLLPLLHLLRTRLSAEEGATAVEYGLLVAFIAVMIIGAVTMLGAQLQTMYCDVVNGLAGPGTCVP